MGRVVWIGVGLVVGVAVALRLKPASETSCCKRVAQAVRDKVGSACGPAGALCTGVGDLLGVFDQAPSLLDRFGL